MSARCFFGMPKDVSEGSRAVSFEVSPVLLRLRQSGRIDGQLAVTFVPTKVPAEGEPAVDLRNRTLRGLTFAIFLPRWALSPIDGLAGTKRYLSALRQIIHCRFIAPRGR